jgi:hypothetical protein
MEAPHTPYDFKELLVEISVRKCMGDSMSEAVSPKNLIAMSMLDSGCLRDLGTSLYSGPDLFTSLRHDMSGSSREKWIEAQLMSLLRDEALKNEIDRLLNEDLKTAGKQDLITMGAQLANKVSVSNLASRVIGADIQTYRLELSQAIELETPSH